MVGYHRYQGEQKRGDLLIDRSHRLENWDTLGRSPKPRHSSKSFLGREAECDQGKAQSRKGGWGHDLRQEA